MHSTRPTNKKKHQVQDESMSSINVINKEKINQVTKQVITQVTQINKMHQVHVTFNLLCKDLEPENFENPELNHKRVRSHTIINNMKVIQIIGHLKSSKELLQVEALSKYH